MFTRRLLIKNLFKSSLPPPPFFLKNPSWEPPPSPFSHFLTKFTRAAHAHFLCHMFNLPYKHSHKAAQCAKDLLARKDIVIKPSDKNLGPAILDIDWYIQQVMSHLQDTHTYCRISDWQQELTTNNTMNKYKQLVDSVVNHCTIKHQPQHKLREYLLHKLHNYTIPPFYIIPKVHKLPHASRPISASHSFFSSPLAHWVQYHLLQVVKNLPTVAKNSLEVIKEVKDLYIPPNSLLVSADIVAMYPNINITHGVQIIQNNIYNYLPFDTARLVVDALTFLLNNHYTTFNEIIYKQVCGTAMGVQFAPSYANAYTYFLFLPTVTKYKHYLTIYKTYIDDLFWVWTGNLEDLNSFIKELNSIMPQIRLEVTISPSSIVFLDVVFTLNNTTHRLEYAPYSKPLNKHLYIPFSSNHPTSNKKGWIKGELTRLARLSHDKTTYIHAAQRLYVHLLRRGYPCRFLLPIFTTTTYSSIHTRTPPPKTDNTTYLLLKYTPYIATWNPLTILHDMAHPNKLTTHQYTLTQNTCASWKTYPNLHKRLVRAAIPSPLERLVYHIQTHSQTSQR